jgi:hypothetical protein
MGPGEEQRQTRRPRDMGEVYVRPRLAEWFPVVRPSGTTCARIGGHPGQAPSAHTGQARAQAHFVGRAVAWMIRNLISKQRVERTV